MAAQTIRNAEEVQFVTFSDLFACNLLMTASFRYLLAHIPIAPLTRFRAIIQYSI